MCILEDLYHRFAEEPPETAALREAARLLAQGEYRRALGYFDAAEKHPRTSAEALNGKLQALMALEAYDDAKKCIDRALNDFPDNTVAYTYKALLHARENRLDEAIDCFDRIIAVAPADENAYLAKSELLVKKGDFEGARQTAEALLERNPESEAANFQAAKAFFGLKEYDKAMRLFGKVVSMNPDNDNARSAETLSLDQYRQSEKNELRLALTLLDSKMYADSLRHFGNMLSQGENSAEVHFFLGKAYKGLGDTSRMIESMEQAARLAKHSTAPYLEIGEQLLADRRNEEAMAYFDKALAIDPSDRLANIRKGEYLQRQGRPADADKYYDRILSRDNHDAEAYLKKGITAMDRYPAAGNPLLYFDKAMEANPAYALPMYYRGQFQLILGQKERYALESFNKAAFLASMSGDQKLLEKCRKAIRSLASDEN